MLIFYQAIMALAGFFGLTRVLRLPQPFLKYILALQCIAIILSFTSVDSILLFYLPVLLIIIYAAIAKDMTTIKRSIIVLIALPVLAHGVFTMNHWPHVYELKFLQLLPLALYAGVVLPKRNDYYLELPSLTIIAADALIQVISLMVR
ncbi:MAG: hypothetical protein KDC07_09175 [Chitinophagaceae bacterium]|nr:hypothetical protein [Chitinophagaceae bacterium]MCB9045053.1 hypothetical protein [Chitinophagales bacterium]